MPPELLALMQGGGQPQGMSEEVGEDCCPMCGQKKVMPFNSNQTPNMAAPQPPQAQQQIDPQMLMAMLGGMGGGQQAPMSPY